MKKTTLIIAIIIFIGVGVQADASLLKELQEQGGNVSYCTQEYAPVCGKRTIQGQTKAITFPNACIAKKAKAEIMYEGPCKGTIETEPPVPTRVTATGTVQMPEPKLNGEYRRGEIRGGIKGLNGNNGQQPRALKQLRGDNKMIRRLPPVANMDQEKFRELQNGAREFRGANREQVREQMAKAKEVMAQAQEFRKKRLEEAKKYREQAQEFRKKNLEKMRKYRESVKSEVSEARAKVEAKKEEYKKRLAEAKTKEERQKIGEEIKAERERLEQKIKERRKELFDRVKGFLKDRLAAVEKRLEAYLAKAERIDQRVDAKLSSLEEQGHDVSRLRAKQKEAREFVAKAKADFEKFKEAARQAVNDEDREQLKKLLNDAREQIKSYKKNIKSFFADVREIIKGMNLR